MHCGRIHQDHWQKSTVSFLLQHNMKGVLFSAVIKALPSVATMLLSCLYCSVIDIFHLGGFQDVIFNHANKSTTTTHFYPSTKFWWATSFFLCPFTPFFSICDTMSSINEQQQKNPLCSCWWARTTMRATVLWGKKSSWAIHLWLFSRGTWCQATPCKPSLGCSFSE